MPLDPRRLKPSELCRLVNSTPLGAVLDERQLYRQRTRAGFRIGDGRQIDLLRYCAWLVQERHASKSPSSATQTWDERKDQVAARNAALSVAGRDIGELARVADPARRARASAEFRYFCEVYFPQTFHLEWSPDHLKVIAKIEQAVRQGGLFAMAMPRGSGKTTLCECGCIWAVLNGHREFVCLIGSDEGHAVDMLESIKTELDANDLLLADYPEVCRPIEALDGIASLTNQLLNREWKRDDGAMMKIERVLIDANWGSSTDVIYQFCRSSPHAALLLPSHGRFVGASSLPMADWQRRPGDRVGLHWRIPGVLGKRAVRHVVYDTNFWKSFLFARLGVGIADRGSLSLFGRKPEIHRLFAEHLTAEYRVRTAGRGRTVDEWKPRPGHPDNHWLDGVVGCAVAASMQGAQLFGTESAAPAARPRLKLSSMKRPTA